LMLYGKIIAVYCGPRAEHGNSPWAQNAVDINGKAGGIYIYIYIYIYIATVVS
jgi:hypothetical protein